MSKKKKNKIYIDPSSLEVSNKKASPKEIALKIGGYFLLALLFFSLALFLSYYILDSPKELRLKNELKEMAQQYKYLNKRLDQFSLVLEDLQQRDENLYRIVFEAEPPQRNNPLYNDYSRFKDMDAEDLLVETTKKTDELLSKVYSQSLSYDEIYKMAKTKKERLECMPAILPINKADGRLVSGFGLRYHPIFKTLRPHTGVDFAARRGIPIYATGDGYIESTGNSSRGYSGYGIYCIVNHGFGYKTLYAHMERLNVKNGKKIKRGDIIGYVGSTGYSTGPHLHYEVHVNGKKVNPVYYFFIDISPEEYLDILEQSREVNQSLS